MSNIKLMALRKEKNFSMDKMAKEIGVSKSYYEKIEYGDRSPSYNFIMKFKKRFPEIDIREIFL